MRIKYFENIKEFLFVKDEFKGPGIADKNSLLGIYRIRKRIIDSDGVDYMVGIEGFLNELERYDGVNVWIYHGIFNHRMIGVFCSEGDTDILGEIYNSKRWELQVINEPVNEG